MMDVYFLTVPEAMKEVLAAEHWTRGPGGGISAVGRQDRVAQTGGIWGVLNHPGRRGPTGVGRPRAGTALPDVARGGGGGAKEKQKAENRKRKGKWRTRSRELSRKGRCAG